MGAKTGIEWTSSTWNPIAAFLTRDIIVNGKTYSKGTRGWLCTKVSPGCANCYAEGINLRLGNGLTYVRASLDAIEWSIVSLDDPLRWTKPRPIFVCSMCDLFHASIPDALIDQIFAVMALAQRHSFQVLTKRPDRMRKYLSDQEMPKRISAFLFQEEQRIIRPCTKAGRAHLLNVQSWIDRLDRGEGFPLPNVHVGTSIENQEAAETRLVDLFATPAAVRFISAEPLLGPVDLIAVWQCIGNELRREQVISPRPVRDITREEATRALHYVLDQVIVGGESGRLARPMHPDWARDLRDQCVAAGVAFFFKQWGEWAPHNPTAGGDLGRDVRSDRVRIVHPTGESDVEVAKRNHGRSTIPNSRYLVRVGKQAAGRTLDGKIWSEYPAAF